MAVDPMERESEPSTNPAWRVEQEGFDQAREAWMGSIFTLGNGYLGIRADLDGTVSGSDAALFVAGIYDTKQSTLPYSEPEIVTEYATSSALAELVPLPFPFRISLSVDGRPLNVIQGPIRDHRRVLDLKFGLLSERNTFEDEHGRRTVIETLRCASMSDLHLLLQEIEVRCENYSGVVELATSLEEPDLGRNHPHLKMLQGPENDIGLEATAFVTNGSRLLVAIASKTMAAGQEGASSDWKLNCGIGERLKFRRCVSVFTSRDKSDPAQEARRHLESKTWETFTGELDDHKAQWSEFWRAADIQVEGDPSAQQALRFNNYHLRIAADRDPRVSVGARTLSGRAYEGHVFWDTDIFMLPFYIYSAPSIARSLVLYRFNTLEGARRRASETGHRGAFYAWESTATGEDLTPRAVSLRSTRKVIPIFSGTEEVHISADVAYGIMRYWDATQDLEFMRDAGGEILIETGRFWASRCTNGNRYYHIRGVSGPDEYHHTVNDNAYTNWMAKYNLERAVWACDWLKRQFPKRWGELQSERSISTNEMREWEAIANNLFFPEPNSKGVIEQFEGFFDLADCALEKRDRPKVPISRLLDWEEINRVKVIKQADVLMMLYLFPDRFPIEVVDVNYRYYEPITDHGSSLSPCIHAALAARLGLREDAEIYWRRSLWLDLTDAIGNSALGIHAGAMGGSWQALVFGFLGVRFEADGPVIDPVAATLLPPKWQSVALTLAYRRKVFPLRVVRDTETSAPTQYRAPAGGGRGE